jgi:hypothetical protein
MGGDRKVLETPAIASTDICLRKIAPAGFYALGNPVNLRELAPRRADGL